MCFISTERWNFSYVFNVLISNGDWDIDLPFLRLSRFLEVCG